MGRRSDFPRRPHDDYETPPEAVAPLLPHLAGIERFAEPMAGRGLLIAALESAGLECVYAAELRTGMNPPYSRIAEGVDALAVGRYAYQSAGAEVIISNPPWTRQLMHPLIWHLCGIMPTWLLFDADWVHTKQSAALIRFCSTIVSVGRIRWMPGSKSTGKDNAAWHLFDRHHVDGPKLIGRHRKEGNGAAVEVALKTGGEVVAFDPARAKTNDAKADALIAYAKKVKDWPLLAEAVDQKMKDQADFIQWWDDALRKKGGAGGYR